jgi:hypothetical protein
MEFLPLKIYWSKNNRKVRIKSSAYEPIENRRAAK